MEQNISPASGETDVVLENFQTTKQEQDLAVQDKNPLKTASAVPDNNFLVSGEIVVEQENFQTTKQGQDVMVQENIDELSKIPLKSDSAVLDDDFIADLISRNSQTEMKAEITNSEKVSETDFIIDSSKETPSSDIVNDSEKVTETNFIIDISNETSSCDIVNDSENATEIEIIAEISKENQGSVTEKVPLESSINKYRDEDSLWSDDDDSSSTSDSSSSSLSDTEFRKVMVESSAPKKFPVVKTKGELGLDELPLLEDLVISVKEQEMMIIGKIHAVVDKLVVIHAYKDTKPLDFDSVLFLSYDKPLGRVFDVFGPVVEPMYCVRFNSTEDIKSKGVEIGVDVFFAPEKSEITSYVFVDELRKQKGSDASWKFNNEPPEELLDYSDDEEEKAAKRKRLLKNRNRQFSNHSEIAPKRPAFSGASSPQSNYGDDVRVISPRNNAEHYSFHFPRSNPFAPPPIRPPSPTPSICSVMSTAIRVPNSFSCSTPQLSQPQRQFSQQHRLQRPSFNLSTPRSYPSDSLRPPSPTSSVCSTMSTAIRVSNSFGFSSPRLPQSQRPFPQQHIIQRPPSPFLYNPFQPPPPVFGQVAVLSALPSPLPSPSHLSSPFVNTALIPASHSPVTPQNYFSQRFPRNPSPASQTHFAPGNSGMYLAQRFPCSPPPLSPGQHALPDPWLSNRSPSPFVPSYPQVTPNHSLALQIPNQGNPPVSVHAFQPSGIHLQLQPFANSVNFNGSSMQSRFY